MFIVFREINSVCEEYVWANGYGIGVKAKTRGVGRGEIMKCQWRLLSEAVEIVASPKMVLKRTIPPSIHTLSPTFLFNMNGCGDSLLAKKNAKSCHVPSKAGL